MSKPLAARRRARGSTAAIACAGLAGAWLAAFTGAGCFDTVSLGAGLGDGGGGAGGATVPTHTTSGGGGEEELPDLSFDCLPGLHSDLDHDGATPAGGDCNDCDPEVGPNAVEMPTEDGAKARDENCNGVVDEALPVCDQGLAVDDASPLGAARAIDLCRAGTSSGWGVVKAAWVLPDGSPPPQSLAFALGHGLLRGFGPNVSVRHGHRLLALSSGTARQPSDPGYLEPRGFVKGYESAPPDGFPKESPACPGVVSGRPHDAVALELQLRVPQNAGAFAFDFDFYTYEFPRFLCSQFNDLFVALLLPAPGGQADANVSFDRFGNTVSVNSAFLEACGCNGGPPCVTSGRQFSCALGVQPLLGTGFGADTTHDENHGATGWLTTISPVEPNTTATLRFAIQDSGDGLSDSTVLLDHFRWLPRAVEPTARTHRVLDD